MTLAEMVEWSFTAMMCASMISIAVILLTLAFKAVRQIWRDEIRR